MDKAKPRVKRTVGVEDMDASLWPALAELPADVRAALRAAVASPGAYAGDAIPAINIRMSGCACCEVSTEASVKTLADLRAAYALNVGDDEVANRVADAAKLWSAGPDMAVVVYWTNDDGGVMQTVKMPGHQLAKLTDEAADGIKEREAARAIEEAMQDVLGEWLAARGPLPGLQLKGKPAPADVKAIKISLPGPESAPGDDHDRTTAHGHGHSRGAAAEGAGAGAGPGWEGLQGAGISVEVVSPATFAADFRAYVDTHPKAAGYDLSKVEEQELECWNRGAVRAYCMRNPADVMVATLLKRDALARGIVTPFVSATRASQK